MITQAPGPPPDPNLLPRVLAGMLAVLAAGLVIAGTFLSLTSLEETVRGRLVLRQSTTPWTRVDEASAETGLPADAHVAHYGVPLTVLAVALLAGAALAFAAARGGARESLRTMARGTLLTGAAGTATAVWMIGMDVSSTLSYEQRSADVVAHFTIGTGFWVLLGAGVVAVVTLGLALLAGRRPRTEPPFAWPAGSTGRHHAPVVDPMPTDPRYQLPPLGQSTESGEPEQM